MDLVISSMCDFQGEIKKLNDQIKEIKGNLADNITNYSGLKDSLAFSYSHSGQMLGKYTRRRVMIQYPQEKYAKSYSGFVSEGNCFDDEKGIMLLKNGSLLRGKFLGNKHFKRVDDKQYHVIVFDSDGLEEALYDGQILDFQFSGKGKLKCSKSD